MEESIGDRTSARALDDQTCVLIVLIHLRELMGKIMQIILPYAYSINPEVLNA